MPPDNTAIVTDFDKVIAELARRLSDENKASKRASLSALFKHPATLLVLTFALTSVVGGSLASSWQRSEWVDQQVRINIQREVEQKYKLVDDLTAAVAEATTGAEEVLVLTYWDLPNLKSEWLERQKYWRTSSRSWRVASKRLQASIAAHFAPRVVSAFDQLILDRKQWGNDITSLLASPMQVRSSLQEMSAKTLKDVNDTIQHLKSTTELMVSEIHSDEQKAWEAEPRSRALFK
jgi:hypothetical protein